MATKALYVRCASCHAFLSVKTYEGSELVSERLPEAGEEIPAVGNVTDTYCPTCLEAVREKIRQEKQRLK